MLEDAIASRPHPPSPPPPLSPLSVVAAQHGASTLELELKLSLPDFESVSDDVSDVSAASTSDATTTLSASTADAAAAALLAISSSGELPATVPSSAAEPCGNIQPAIAASEEDGGPSPMVVDEVEASAQEMPSPAPAPAQEMQSPAPAQQMPSLSPAQDMPSLSSAQQSPSHQEAPLLTSAPETLPLPSAEVSTSHVLNSSSPNDAPAIVDVALAVHELVSAVSQRVDASQRESKTDSSSGLAPVIDDAFACRDKHRDGRSPPSSPKGGAIVVTTTNSRERHSRSRPAVSRTNARLRVVRRTPPHRITRLVACAWSLLGYVCPRGDACLFNHGDKQRCIPDVRPQFDRYPSKAPFAFALRDVRERALSLVGLKRLTHPQVLPRWLPPPDAQPKTTQGSGSQQSYERRPRPRSRSRRSRTRSRSPPRKRSVLANPSPSNTRKSKQSPASWRAATRPPPRQRSRSPLPRRRKSRSRSRSGPRSRTSSSSVVSRSPQRNNNSAIKTKTNHRSGTRSRSRSRRASRQTSTGHTRGGGAKSGSRQPSRSRSRSPSVGRSQQSHRATRSSSPPQRIVTIKPSVASGADGNINSLARSCAPTRQQPTTAMTSSSANLVDGHIVTPEDLTQALREVAAIAALRKTQMEKLKSQGSL
jgi:hypothetical protein